MIEGQRHAAPRLGVLYLVVLTVALAFYAATLAPDLVWQDSGFYQWEAARFNLYRPGEAVRVHPWLLVVARALWWPALWNYARAANLASAIGTALAVANLALLVRLLARRTWPAVVAAVAFGVGHAVWRHAVIAETYGWVAAFLTLECLLAYRHLRTARTRWLVLVFLANGVAITNHLMAVFSLAVFGAWMLWRVLRRETPVWALPAAAGLWILGGTLYWVVVGIEYAQTGDVGATLRSATVGGFGAAVANLSGVGGMFLRSVLYVGLNYPTPVALAAFIGIPVAWRLGALGRLILLLALVYLVWAVRYRVPDQYAFFVPFYVFASVLIGLGALRFVEWRPRWMPGVLLALALVPVAVYAVLPSIARRSGVVLTKRELPYRDSYTYFLQPWKTCYEGARRFGEEALAAVPDGGLVLADTTSSPPMKCLHDIEGVAPGVHIVDGYDALFYPALRPYWKAEENLLPGLLAEGRRVFVVTPRAGYAPAWAVEHCGFVPAGVLWEVVPRGEGLPAEGSP